MIVHGGHVCVGQRFRLCLHKLKLDEIVENIVDGNWSVLRRACKPLTYSHQTGLEIFAIFVSNVLVSSLFVHVTRNPLLTLLFGSFLVIFLRICQLFLVCGKLSPHSRARFLSAQNPSSSAVNVDRNFPFDVSRLYCMSGAGKHQAVLNSACACIDQQTFEHIPPLSTKNKSHGPDLISHD